jgi:hypothetical protein
VTKPNASANASTVITSSIVVAAPVHDELRRRRQMRALRKLVERAAQLEAEERRDLAR